MPKLIPSPTIIAIDPGTNGGVCVLHGTRVVLHGLPQSEHEAYQLVHGLCEVYKPDIAVVEWINPGMHGVNKSAISKLYGSYMASRMLLACCGLDFQTVMPVKWQRGLGITARGKKETTTNWKKRLKTRGQQLFPGARISLKTADALLLAAWARRNLARS